MAEEKKDIQKDDPQKITEYAIPETDITKEELDELKKEYKKLFRTFFIDDVYIWHRINRKTFNDICAETENIEDEDEMIAAREKRFCEECIIYPRKEKMEESIQDDIIASKLAQEILYKSGFFRPITDEI